ncbi:MAG: hypothetical protein ACRC3A_08640 [Culicoidibacterales bacterium]
MNLNKQQLQAQSLACVRWFKRLKLETLVIGLVVIHILAICNYVFIFPTLPLQVYFTFNSVLLISYLFLWCVSLAKAKATRTRLFLIGSLVYWLICLIGSILNQSALLVAGLETYYIYGIILVFVPIYNNDYIYFIQAFYLIIISFVSYNWFVFEQGRKLANHKLN